MKPKVDSQKSSTSKIPSRLVLGQGISRLPLSSKPFKKRPLKEPYLSSSKKVVVKSNDLKATTSKKNLRSSNSIQNKNKLEISNGGESDQMEESDVNGYTMFSHNLRNRVVKSKTESGLDKETLFDSLEETSIPAIVNKSSPPDCKEVTPTRYRLRSTGPCSAVNPDKELPDEKKMRPKKNVQQTCCEEKSDESKVDLPRNRRRDKLVAKRDDTHIDAYEFLDIEIGFDDKSSTLSAKVHEKINIDNGDTSDIANNPESESSKNENFVSKINNLEKSVTCIKNYLTHTQSKERSSKTKIEKKTNEMLTVETQESIVVIDLENDDSENINGVDFTDKDTVSNIMLNMVNSVTEKCWKSGISVKTEDAVSTGKASSEITLSSLLKGGPVENNASNYLTKTTQSLKVQKESLVNKKQEVAKYKMTEQGHLKSSVDLKNFRNPKYVSKDSIDQRRSTDNECKISMEKVQPSEVLPSIIRSEKEESFTSLISIQPYVNNSGNNPENNSSRLQQLLERADSIAEKDVVPLSKNVNYSRKKAVEKNVLPQSDSIQSTNRKAKKTPKKKYPSSTLSNTLKLDRKPPTSQNNSCTPKNVTNVKQILSSTQHEVTSQNSVGSNLVTVNSKEAEGSTNQRETQQHLNLTVNKPNVDLLNLLSKSGQPHRNNIYRSQTNVVKPTTEEKTFSASELTSSFTDAKFQNEKLNKNGENAKQSEVLPSSQAVQQKAPPLNKFQNKSASVVTYNPGEMNELVQKSLNSIQAYNKRAPNPSNYLINKPPPIKLTAKRKLNMNIQSISNEHALGTNSTKMNKLQAANRPSSSLLESGAQSSLVNGVTTSQSCLANPTLPRTKNTTYKSFSPSTADSYKSCPPNCSALKAYLTGQHDGKVFSGQSDAQSQSIKPQQAVQDKIQSWQCTCEANTINQKALGKTKYQLGLSSSSQPIDGNTSNNGKKGKTNSSKIRRVSQKQSFKPKKVTAPKVKSSNVKKTKPSASTDPDICVIDQSFGGTSPPAQKRKYRKRKAETSNQTTENGDSDNPQSTKSHRPTFTLPGQHPFAINQYEGQSQVPTYQQRTVNSGLNNQDVGGRPAMYSTSDPPSLLRGFPPQSQWTECPQPATIPHIEMAFPEYLYDSPTRSNEQPLIADFLNFKVSPVRSTNFFPQSQSRGSVSHVNPIPPPYTPCNGACGTYHKDNHLHRPHPVYANIIIPTEQYCENSPISCSMNSSCSKSTNSTQSCTITSNTIPTQCYNRSPNSIEKHYAMNSPYTIPTYCTNRWDPSYNNINHSNLVQNCSETSTRNTCLQSNPCAATQSDIYDHNQEYLKSDRLASLCYETGSVQPSPYIRSTSWYTSGNESPSCSTSMNDSSFSCSTNTQMCSSQRNDSLINCANLEMFLAAEGLMKLNRKSKKSAFKPVMTSVLSNNTYSISSEKLSSCSMDHNCADSNVSRNVRVEENKLSSNEGTRIEHENTFKKKEIGMHQTDGVQRVSTPVDSVPVRYITSGAHVDEQVNEALSGNVDIETLASKIKEEKFNTSSTQQSDGQSIILMDTGTPIHTSVESKEDILPDEPMGTAAQHGKTRNNDGEEHTHQETSKLIMKKIETLSNEDYNTCLGKDTISEHHRVAELKKLLHGEVKKEISQGNNLTKLVNGVCKTVDNDSRDTDRSAFHYIENEHNYLVADSSQNSSDRTKLTSKNIDSEQDIKYTHDENHFQTNGCSSEKMNANIFCNILDLDPETIQIMKDVVDIVEDRVNSPSEVTQYVIDNVIARVEEIAASPANLTYNIMDTVIDKGEQITKDKNQTETTAVLDYKVDKVEQNEDNPSDVVQIIDRIVALIEALGIGPEERNDYEISQLVDDTQGSLSDIAEILDGDVLTEIVEAKLDKESENETAVAITDKESNITTDNKIAEENRNKALAIVEKDNNLKIFQTPALNKTRYTNNFEETSIECVDKECNAETTDAMVLTDTNLELVPVYSLTKKNYNGLEENLNLPLKITQSFLSNVMTTVKNIVKPFESKNMNIVSEITMTNMGFTRSLNEKRMTLRISNNDQNQTDHPDVINIEVTCSKQQEDLLNQFEEINGKCLGSNSHQILETSNSTDNIYRKHEQLEKYDASNGNQTSLKSVVPSLTTVKDIKTSRPERYSSSDRYERFYANENGELSPVKEPLGFKTDPYCNAAFINKYLGLNQLSDFNGTRKVRKITNGNSSLSDGSLNGDHVGDVNTGGNNLRESIQLENIHIDNEAFDDFMNVDITEYLPDEVNQHAFDNLMNVDITEYLPDEVNQHINRNNLRESIELENIHIDNEAFDDFMNVDVTEYVPDEVNQHINSSSIPYENGSYQIDTSPNFIQGTANGSSVHYLNQVQTNLNLTQPSQGCIPIIQEYANSPDTQRQNYFPNGDQYYFPTDNSRKRNSPSSDLSGKVHISVVPSLRSGRSQFSNDHSGNPSKGYISPDSNINPSGKGYFPMENPVKEHFPMKNPVKGHFPMETPSQESCITDTSDQEGAGYDRLRTPNYQQAREHCGNPIHFASIPPNESSTSAGYFSQRSESVASMDSDFQSLFPNSTNDFPDYPDDQLVENERDLVDTLYTQVELQVTPKVSSTNRVKTKDTPPQSPISIKSTPRKITIQAKPNEDNYIRVQQSGNLPHHLVRLSKEKARSRLFYNFDRPIALGSPNPRTRTPWSPSQEGSSTGSPASPSTFRSPQGPISPAGGPFKQTSVNEGMYGKQTWDKGSEGFYASPSRCSPYFGQVGSPNCSPQLGYSTSPTTSMSSPAMTTEKSQTSSKDKTLGHAANRGGHSSSQTKTPGNVTNKRGHKAEASSGQAVQVGPGSSGRSKTSGRGVSSMKQGAARTKTQQNKKTTATKAAQLCSTSSDNEGSSLSSNPAGSHHTGKPASMMLAAPKSKISPTSSQSKFSQQTSLPSFSSSTQKSSVNSVKLGVTSSLASSKQSVSSHSAAWDSSAGSYSTSSSEQVIVPCVYSVYGCTAHLSTSEIPHHEFSCQFQCIKCPSCKCNICSM